MKEKSYELLWRNKYLSTHAESFDDIINALEGAVNQLKEMKATGLIEYTEGADDDYAMFITTDTEIAEKYGFEEIEDDDEEDDFDDFDDEDDGDEDLADEDNIVNYPYPKGIEASREV